MIFGWVVFPAMTSMIAMTRSPLQASLSSAGGQVVAIICKGRGASRRPNEDSYSWSSISSSLVTERNSRLEGDESASYATPDNATIDILSSIHMRFGLVPKRWFLRYVQCFGVGWIRHKDCTLAPTFDGCYWERRRWKNLDRVLCIFLFQIFYM